MSTRRARSAFGGLAVLSLVLMAGCPGTGVSILEAIAGDFEAELEVEGFQDEIFVDLPPELESRGETIIVHEEVEVITVIEEDLVVEELPDITLLAFENLTGNDLYIEYFAEDSFESVFIFDGEALLLEYPCLFDLELVAEVHVDPFTGEIIEEFVYSELFLNPDDFICGEAIIFTFDPFTVDVTIDSIDLVR